MSFHFFACAFIGRLWACSFVCTSTLALYHSFMYSTVSLLSGIYPLPAMHYCLDEMTFTLKRGRTFKNIFLTLKSSTSFWVQALKTYFCLIFCFSLLFYIVHQKTWKKTYYQHKLMRAATKCWSKCRTLNLITCL